jgi:hypothetical protein
LTVVAQKSLLSRAREQAVRYANFCNFVLVLLLALPVFAQPPAGDDAMLRAMRDEMARSRGLRLLDLDRPYYIEYAADDVWSYGVSATLGALIGERHTRIRVPRVNVRVGDYKFDNTNHVYSDASMGARFDPGQLPLDDNYDALRQCFWLATDRVYKQAIEAIARKRASLKNLSVSEELADFSKAETVKLVLPVVRTPVNEAMWRERVKKVSTVFEKFPAIYSSLVDYENNQSVAYLVTSEGTEQRYPERFGTFRVRASTLAPDGSELSDVVIFASLDPDGLPSEADMLRGATALAENLTALAAAPAGESYTGPVLFEGDAAAALYAQLLGRNLIGTRRPVSDPNRPTQAPQSELEGRLASRILPESFDVVDDPTQVEWRGRRLFGHFVSDIEGLPPKPLVLVEKGVLKDFLRTRTPIKGFDGSNARGRLPGAFGSKTALFSNLFIRSSQPLTSEALRARLLELCKQRSKSYCMVVRKLDFPSSSSFDNLRRMLSGTSGGGAVSLPVLAYRIYLDGREELVRGLRFRSLTVRSLKDIVAAGDTPHLYNYLENGALFATLQAGGYVSPVTVAAPPTLFDDIELERPQVELPKLPVSPPPALTATN